MIGKPMADVLVIGSGAAGAALSLDPLLDRGRENR